MERFQEDLITFMVSRCIEYLERRIFLGTIFRLLLIYRRFWPAGFEQTRRIGGVCSWWSSPSINGVGAVIGFEGRLTEVKIAGRVFSRHACDLVRLRSIQVWAHSSTSLLTHAEERPPSLTGGGKVPVFIDS